MEKKDWKAQAAHSFITFVYLCGYSPHCEIKLLACTVLPSSGHHVLQLQERGAQENAFKEAKEGKWAGAKNTQ